MIPVEKLMNWIEKTEMKTISVGMLKDWILEMQEEEKNQMTDIQALKVISSYLTHLIDPQPSINLMDLSHLHPEDLVDYEIPKELFSIHEYTLDEIQDMRVMLSSVIVKMENKEIDNI